MNWYNESTDSIIDRLGSNSEKGLTDSAVKILQLEHGPNEIVERGKKSPWLIFFDQFKNVMVIILIVAAIISLLLGEFIEAIVILAIVILNAILGFTQENRAEESMAALKKLAVPRVRVLRGGHIVALRLRRAGRPVNPRYDTFHHNVPISPSIASCRAPI